MSILKKYLSTILITIEKITPLKISFHHICHVMEGIIIFKFLQTGLLITNGDIVSKT